MPRVLSAGALAFVLLGHPFAVRSAFGQTCGGSIGPDVIVGGVGVSNNGINNSDIINYPSASIGGVSYETFSMATTSCNLGNQPLIWTANSSTDNQHPVISQNFFRLKNVNGARRFEQLAQGWLKHGFCALTEHLCCTCTPFGNPCDYLGVGCSDPYTGARNGGQTFNQECGPKWQVNATTGVHVEPRANPAGATSSSVSRRMHIPVTELEVSNGAGDVNTTRYFGECMYVHQDDAASGNKNNNASYRAISVSGGGTAWAFGAVGTTSNTTQQTRPGIRAWVDTDTTPTTPDVITRVVETDITTPEDAGLTALIILGAQATKLGNALWHFEYALENVNSDRSIASFSIPISGYASVTNIGFRDVAYWDGDGINSVTTDAADWPGAAAGGAVSWACTQTYDQNNNANALRWGTMYNFRFDCDQPPEMIGGDVALIDALMVQFKPNAQRVTGGTVAPAALTCTRGDINGDGLIDGADIGRFTQILVNGNATATPREKCAGDVAASPDFGIGVDDIDNFSNCLLAGAGC